jgi:phosphoserine aminotransferase
MNKIYFTVGPTEIYPEVKKIMLKAFDDKIFSLSHRGREFTDINYHTEKELKKLMSIPDNFYVFYVGSATEAMERIIQNLAGKKSFHFINGYFAERFFNIAKQLKKIPYSIKTKYGEGFDFAKVKIPKDSELICFTHNETSTGVALNLKDIYKIKENNPGKIIAVDVVTSVPYVNIDFRKIDCAFFSVQKGFGMPPGLGVIIIRKSCIEKTKNLKDRNCNIGSFHNFITLAENAKKNQTAVTPNIPAIYILGKVCELMNKKGIEKIRKETIAKAEMMYDYFENNAFPNRGLGTRVEIKPFVTNEKLRSNTTLVFNVNNNSNVIVSKLIKKGFVISRGYRDFKDAHIRISNFPMHKIADVKRMLEVFKNI